MNTILKNEAMRSALKRVGSDKPSLPNSLRFLINEGFAVRAGCVLLKHLSLKAINATPRDFPDLTGYECFVNSLHIDDYVEADYLANALQYADYLLRFWINSGLDGVINVIVSSDEFGAVVRFHKVRENESWIGNIEKFADPILAINSKHLLTKKFWLAIDE